jgi:hypothetical protein
MVGARERGGQRGRESVWECVCVYDNDCANSACTVGGRKSTSVRRARGEREGEGGRSEREG